MNKDTFEVLCVEENEDGSAVIEVEAGPEMRKQFIEEGINFLLVKGALGCDTDEILRWAIRGKEEEQNDTTLSDFNEAMIELNDLRSIEPA